MNIKSIVLPLPTILNERSLTRSPSHYDFIQLIKNLLCLIKYIKKYGFSMQVECSKKLFDSVCYDDVSFSMWLQIDRSINEDESVVRKYMRMLITKAPRFEEKYSDFIKGVEFDLLQNNLQIYPNQDSSIPAFLLSIYFNLPSVSFATNEYLLSYVFRLTKRSITSDGIVDDDENVHSFSIERQIDECNRYFIDVLNTSIRTVDDFRRVAPIMFPNLSFSDQVYDALDKNRIQFSTLPIIYHLIKLQKSFDVMLTSDCLFSDAYGDSKSLVMDESNATKQLYPGSRIFTWEDIKRVCYSHIRINLKYRLHFNISKQDKMIYIGYIGTHLPTKKFA